MLTCCVPVTDFLQLRASPYVDSQGLQVVCLRGSIQSSEHPSDVPHFSIYKFCKSQKDRLKRSLNICIFRNHFSSPNSFIVNFFFNNEVIWVTASVSFFRNVKTISLTKKKQIISPFVITQGFCGISEKPNFFRVEVNFVCYSNGDRLRL